MKILLDTSAYSDLKRGHSDIAALVRQSAEIVFSPIVAGELLHGFRRGSQLERNVRDLQSFLESSYVTMVPVTWSTAHRFARIADQLRKKGTPVPTNDIWIAAQAMETGADLVSSDEHFSHIEAIVWVRSSSR